MIMRKSMVLLRAEDGHCFYWSDYAPVEHFNKNEEFLLLLWWQYATKELVRLAGSGVGTWWAQYSECSVDPHTWMQDSLATMLGDGSKL